MEARLDSVGKVLGHDLGRKVFSALLVRHDWSIYFPN